MEGTPLRFIRKNGRVIPLRMAHRANRAAIATHRAVSTGASAITYNRSLKQKKRLRDRIAPIQVHGGLDALGLGLSITSGALGAATFHSGLKGLLLGQAATMGIDAVGVAATTASVAGKGKRKQRIEEGVKREARNFLVGNAVYYGGLLAQKKTRSGAIQMGSKALSIARRILHV